MKGKCYVEFTFKDGTKQLVFTSFDRSILAEEGASVFSDRIWDFDKGDYVMLRNDAVNVEVFNERPMYDDEVLAYASKFI